MVSFAHPNEQLELILRGVVDIVEREELLAKLTRSAESEEGLTVMAGFDPSSPHLHLGHAVLLRKMRQFQELGHQVVFLIGDFTARIGDPSSREEARVELTAEQVADNARTYEEQVHRILDPSRTKIVYNSQWLEGMSLRELLALASRLPLRDVLVRLERPEPHGLRLHEVLYPVLQAFDSIHLQADIEIGGEDQMPNLLLARDLMAALGMEPQCVVATQLLEGTDAAWEEGSVVGRKMSKTRGNTIDITEAPDEIRRKISKLDAGLVWRYLELLTEGSVLQLRAMQSDVDAGKRSLDDVRTSLSDHIIKLLHG